VTALLSFVPIAAALLFAAAVMGGIAVRSHYERSPGLAAILYPFSILFISGCFEGLRILGALVGTESPVFGDASNATRMFNGLGWFLLCHKHLGLHGVLGWRRNLNLPVVAFTVAFFAWYVAAAALGRRDVPLACGLAFMSATGLYAALSAVFVLRRQVRLWPSAKAGLRMAVFALVVYPTSLVVERLRIQFPFLDPDRRVFEQLYPVFMTTLVVIALPAIFSRAKGPLEEPGDTRAAESLTDREREVALMLREGRSLKEIAAELSLSVPTIKSHSGAAYRKLGVSGRKELSLVRID